MRGSRKWRCCRTTAATLYVQGLAFISMLSSSRAWIGTTIPLAAKAAAPRVEARSSAVHDLSLNDEVADCIPRRTEHFRGALSMSVSELSQHLGGHGRARLAWDCYSIGVDPALYFRGEESLDTCSDVVKLLPGSRRKQRMGAHALQMLAGLYADYTGGGGASGCDSGAPRVDGGVAMVTHISQSSDNTTKVLLKFYDGTAVEMVIIPWNGVRSTLCISSQVGCRQGCTFCATGKMGKVRSLTTDEILAQMFFARKICRIYDNLPPVTNVVFMGMGEPSDNADAVIAATVQLTTRDLFQLSASKVTVSTVAPSPGAFAKFVNAPCVLAWSVHAARDDLRRKLVPTTKYTMVELRQGLIDVLLQRPHNFRTTMLEVALIDGVNDSLTEADEMAEFVRGIVESVPGLKLIVNLIPFNDIGQELLGYRKPAPARVEAFQRLLWSHGIYTHVRATRGDDESAACGQLVTLKKKQQSKPAALRSIL